MPAFDTYNPSTILFDTFSATHHHNQQQQHHEQQPISDNSDVAIISKSRSTSRVPSRATSHMNLTTLPLNEYPGKSFVPSAADFENPPELSLNLSPLSSPCSSITSTSSVSTTNSTTFSSPTSLSGFNPQDICKPTLQTMPNEILTQILQEVILDECNGNPANYYSTVDHFSRILNTCPVLYEVGTPILYRHVAFAHPHAFDRFLTSIEKTGYGVLTRTLDFSGFTSVGLGRSSRMNEEIQMVTSRTILRALELCSNLNEFLASENIDRDIDSNVIEKLFTMPYLQSIDFCGATHSTFVSAVAASCGFKFTETGALERVEDAGTLAYYSRPLPHITRLSLHGCSTLPAPVLGALLQRLPNLTRLDLTHTQITAESLLCLPSSARLTHLSLSKCVRLSSNGTLKFLVLHRAARTLKWLNMMFEATRPSPISADDLQTILRYLPPLEYLNLYGLPVRSLDSLATMNLISLSLGYANITIDDLKRFLSKLNNLEYVDLTGNPNINIWTVQDLALLDSNKNIAMFEFSRDLLAKLEGIVIPGFSVALGQGRRGWLFRGSQVPVAKKLSNMTFHGPSAISGAVQELTPTSPQLQPTQSFTFAAYAKNRIREQKAAAVAHMPTNNCGGSSTGGPGSSPLLSCKSPEARPITVLGMDMGSPAWRNASRKVNVCFVGLGGNMTDNACKERGIYLYYGYRK